MDPELPLLEEGTEVVDAGGHRCVDAAQVGSLLERRVELRVAAQDVAER